MEAQRRILAASASAVPAATGRVVQAERSAPDVGLGLGALGAGGSPVDEVWQKLKATRLAAGQRGNKKPPATLSELLGDAIRDPPPRPPRFKGTMGPLRESEELVAAWATSSCATTSFADPLSGGEEAEIEVLPSFSPGSARARGADVAARWGSCSPMTPAGSGGAAVAAFGSRRRQQDVHSAAGSLAAAAVARLQQEKGSTSSSELRGALGEAAAALAAKGGNPRASGFDARAALDIADGNEPQGHNLVCGVSDAAGASAPWKMAGGGHAQGEFGVCSSRPGATLLAVTGSMSNFAGASDAQCLTSSSSSEASDSEEDSDD